MARVIFPRFDGACRDVKLLAANSKPNVMVPSTQSMRTINPIRMTMEKLSQIRPNADKSVIHLSIGDPAGDLTNRFTTLNPE
jgi:hypothetical protein